MKTKSHTQVSRSLAMGNFSSARWLSTRATMCALVLAAVASQGCFDDDADTSAPADEVAAPSAENLTNEQLVSQIRTTAGIVEDTRKAIDEDNARLSRELRRVGPALTKDQVIAFSKAFFDQAGPAERQVVYANASSTLRFLLGVLLNDADRLSDMIAGGIDGFNHQELYDSYKKLALTPEAEGAVEYVHYLSNAGSSLRSALIPGGEFKQFITDEIYTPAMCRAAAKEIAKDPSRSGVAALQALRNRLEASHHVWDLGLKTIIELEKGGHVPTGISWEGTSLDGAVKSGTMVLSIWEFRDGIDSARAGDYRAAFEDILKGGTGAVGDAVKAYQMLVGTSRAPQWTSTLGNSVAPISAGLGVAFSIISTIESIGEWNGDPSDKAEVVSNILGTVAGVMSLLEFGPAGVAFAILAIGADVVSSVLEAREAAEATEDEREETRKVLRAMTSKLSHPEIHDPLGRATAASLKRFRREILRDKKQVFDGPAETIQWLAWRSPSSFDSDVLTTARKSSLSFEGLLEIKTVAALEPERVKGLLEAVAAASDNPEARNNVLYDFLSHMDFCLKGTGQFAGCGESVVAGWDTAKIISMLKKQDDVHCQSGDGAYCDVWKTGLRNAIKYLGGDDNDTPDGGGGGDGGVDGGAGDGEDNDPNTESYVHIDWPAYDGDGAVKISCYWVRNGSVPAGFTFSTTVPDEQHPGYGYFKMGTACPRGKPEWTPYCCDFDPKAVSSLGGQYSYCIMYENVTNPPVPGAKCFADAVEGKLRSF